jgi:ribosomal protein S27AE
MAVLVRKKELCPNCGYVLKYDVRVNQPDYSGTSIGDKHAVCPKCRKVYLTGKSEWFEKTKKEKRNYYLMMYFSSIFLPLFYSAFLAWLCLVFLPISDDNKLLTTSVIIFLVLFISGFMFQFFGFKKDISESIKRTSQNNG